MRKTKKEIIIEELYKKYRILLFTIAKNILKNNQTAEDIVQQTFVKVIENIDKIENIESSSTKIALFLFRLTDL